MLLELSNTAESTVITGPSAGVTISGNNLSTVFQIDANVTASMSGLTVTKGSAPVSGGGFYNAGSLSLTNVTVTGNSSGVEFCRRRNL